MKMSEKSKTSLNKEIQNKAKSRIDSKAESIEPIDYSFKDLMSLEEINNVLPRYPDKKEPKKVNEKYSSLGLKLGYNALKEINGLYDWCVFSFAFPNNISSLDISFNCLENIPEEVTRFEGLKCLYVHGNKIIDLREIDKLKKLNLLTMLTVHGNPIENLPIFRHYILSKLPTLKHLNFSGISKVDRQTALIRVKTNSTPLVVPIQHIDDEPKKNVSDDDE